MSLAFLSGALSPRPTLAIPLDRTLGLSVLRTCPLRRLSDAFCGSAAVLLALTLGPGWLLGQDLGDSLCQDLKRAGRVTFPKVGIHFVSRCLACLTPRTLGPGAGRKNKGKVKNA